MASNKVLENRGPLQIAVPAAAAVKSNDPILFGTIACVANENDGEATRPSTGMISADCEGGFNLSVTAKSSLSPSTGSAVNVGDDLYYDGGTVDATTKVTYGGTIDKDSTKVLFGTAISVKGATGQLIASGVTATIAVRLAPKP